MADPESAGLGGNYILWLPQSSHLLSGGLESLSHEIYVAARPRLTFLHAYRRRILRPKKVCISEGYELGKKYPELGP